LCVTDYLIGGLATHSKFETYIRVAGGAGAAATVTVG
jgi:hypothetical protein